MIPIIISIAIVASVYFASHAKITITVNHNYPQAPVDNVDNSATEQEIRDAYAKNKVPSMDEIVQAVQELVGGETDANN